MKVTVLFDEETVSQNLKTGFGLSLLINDTVIFDTGSNGKALLHNLSKLNINIEEINTIVVSHEHWDHTGGLAELLSATINPNVYVCPGFSRELKKGVQKAGGKIHMMDGVTKITKDIYSTGEIFSTYKNMPMPEQSLVVKKSYDRAALICGCCHYNLANTIEDIRNNIVSYFNRTLLLDSVIGGFHLKHETYISLEKLNKILFEQGTNKITPLHCCGDNGKKYFRNNFAGTYNDCKVGSVFEI